eukprot:TRINITY_DN21953_c0_g1_i1.p1 TRINITY_DN21953_c0_g1~~TRINITY_DN21953_c0_g1_i1.p1  ORF type:complete len:201 (-),score=34.81 TRINITY_DN21953_c0_g1_i1:185-787(-)
MSHATGSPDASRPHVVFVYGTLMDDRVVQALLTRSPPHVPACVHGVHRFCIKDRVFPAVHQTKNKDHVVKGRILYVTAEELDVLDNFEDPAYARLTLAAFVCVEGDGKDHECHKDGWFPCTHHNDLHHVRAEDGRPLAVRACVYAREKLDSDLYGEWDPTEQYLPARDWYVERAAGIGAELREKCWGDAGTDVPEKNSSS